MVGLRPFVVVANRWAGAGHAHRLVSLIETAAGAPAAAIVELDFSAAFPERLNDALARARRKSDAPMLVCVGGDGTLSLAFDALRHADDAVLAIVPCGSGNDFSSMLGIAPGRAAVETLRSGVARAIDYGTVNGKRFLNCVGIGLDAEVAAMAAQIRARGYAKGFSYYLAALRGLVSVRPIGATLESSTACARFEDLVMITIGNGKWYGGGFMGAPDARLDDGVFDCFAFRDVAGVGKRLALMQRIRRGAHAAEPNVTAFRAQRINVAFDRSVAMHVDGEIMRTQRAEIAIVPLGARVLAPRPR